MGNWLQKVLTPTVASKRTGNLPVRAQGAGNLPAQPLPSRTPPLQTLPNATVIYGIGASLLFVSAFSLFLAGRWFPGVVVFALGGCLTGFALHLLKHQD